MTNDLINKFELFISQNDIEKLNNVWDIQSKTFRDFWKNKIMDDTHLALSDSEIDEIILIMDKNAKGSTQNTFAVAKAMIAQGAWRRLFSQIKESTILKSHLDKLFNSKNDEEKINIINDIYKINEGKKNNLTGKSGNAVNCMLFAYSPSVYIAMISLNDRRRIIEQYKINSEVDFENDSPGKKIIISNNDILDWFKTNGITGSPMMLTRFMYTILKNEWKITDDTKEVDKEIQLEEVTYSEGESTFYMEKELENFLIRNWEKTELGKQYDLIEENGGLVSQQYVTDIGKIDILVQDKKTKELVVIELKKSQTSDDTVGQILRYMGWLEEHKTPGKSVRGIIIANGYDKKLYYALRKTRDIQIFFYKINFSLTEQIDKQE